MKHKRPPAEWDAFYFSMALLVASHSKDPDRQVGAVLVTPDKRQLSIGYNGLPAHVPDDPKLLMDRERKLALVVHAEANCLRQTPFKATGCTLYVTRFPCFECTGLILQAGVSRVVAPMPDFNHERWGQSWARSWATLIHAGVRVKCLPF